MPLLNHFTGPLADDWPWDGVHGTWATTMAQQLNGGLLPADFYAIPLVKRGGQVEIDVATFHQGNGGAPAGAASATAVWSPPRPTRVGSVDFVNLDLFEVQIVQRLGGPHLRAAVELVSPANKDRPGHRQAFAVKCASYLQRQVAVLVIDVVSVRAANLHADLLSVLRMNGQAPWQSPTGLYAVSYRVVPAGEQQDLECWPEALAVRSPLPTMPLWLDAERYVPLALEESYLAACSSLRMPV